MMYVCLIKLYQVVQIIYIHSIVVPTREGGYWCFKFYNIYITIVLMCIKVVANLIPMLLTTMHTCNHLDFDIIHTGSIKYCEKVFE